MDLHGLSVQQCIDLILPFKVVTSSVDFSHYCIGLSYLSS